jgi:hypothetical protein
MSTRLQVVIDDKELCEFQSIARAQHLTMAEWVRQVLRRARREEPSIDSDKKIQCVRESVSCQYPTGDIDTILQDIERGRSGSGDS